MSGLARIVLPVVVEGDALSVVIEELERWIGQRIVDPSRRERWPEGADNHFRGIDAATTQCEATDHHVVGGLNRTAGADVGQAGVGVGIEVVDFDQADTVAAVRTGEGGGVSGWLERGDDSRLPGIQRRDTGGLDFGCLGILPVVVNADGRAGRAEEAQKGISDDAGNSEAG